MKKQLPNVIPHIHHFASEKVGNFLVQSMLSVSVAFLTSLLIIYFPLFPELAIRIYHVKLSQLPIAEVSSMSFIHVSLHRFNF